MSKIEVKFCKIFKIEVYFKKGLTSKRILVFFYVAGGLILMLIRIVELVMDWVRMQMLVLWLVVNKLSKLY